MAFDSVSPVKADGWLGASSGGFVPGMNQHAWQQDDPSQLSGGYIAQMPAWETMHAVLRGNQYLRRIARDYIPALPNETDECYSRRLQQALFTPYTARVIDAAIGLILRKPIQLEGGDETYWEEWAKDVDRQQTPLNEFVRRVLASSIGYGHCGILVDYPKAQGIRSLAEERAASLKPYFGIVDPWEVLGWRHDVRQNEGRLQQVRLRELIVEPSGQFGEEIREQIRVLEPGGYRVFRKEGTDNWMETESGRTSLSEIPLAVTYSDKQLTLVSEPPLLDCAYINLAHYRLQSQHLNALQVAGFPLLVLKGWDDQSPKLQVDVSKALAMPPDGDVSYVEPANQAFQAYMDELEELANQCSNLGITILAQQKMVAEAAKKTQLDRADSNSMLSNISLDLEQTLQHAINMAAEYAGVEPPVVGLSRDFDIQKMDPAEMGGVVQLFNAGIIDQQTALEMLHRGEVLDDATDIEEIMAASELEQQQSMEEQMAIMQAKPAPVAEKQAPPEG